MFVLPSEFFFSKNIIHAPSLIFSQPNSCRLYTHIFSPLSQALFLVFICYVNVFSGVPVLLGSGGPPTIFWLIISVVVYSIYGVLFTGWITHIFEKVFKLQPPAANFNPSSTIIFEPFISLIKASFLKVVPRSIRFSFCFSMRFNPRASQFFMDASTRIGVAYFNFIEVIKSWCRFADTRAFNYGPVFYSFGRFNRSQPPKARTNFNAFHVTHCTEDIGGCQHA